MGKYKISQEQSKTQLLGGKGGIKNAEGPEPSSLCEGFEFTELSMCMVMSVGKTQKLDSGQQTSNQIIWGNVRG